MSLCPDDSATRVILGAGFALLDEPPLTRLMALATKGGFAWCGRRSCRDVHAFAFAPRVWRHARIEEVLWALLACLTDTLDEPAPATAWTQVERLLLLPAGEACFERSTALADLPDIRSPRPFDSAFYLNSALAEIVDRPQDRGSVEGDPVQMAQALRRQRETSRVPWVFNALLNEVEFREGTVEPESIPSEVHLSVTGACNIQCLFCTYSHQDTRRDMVRPEQVAQLDFLRHAQVLRLHSGLGEPTVNRHLPAILTLVTDKHPHLGINFFTNAVSLGRPELIDALVGRAQWINVSLNAASRETWQAMCGSDHFNRVCAGLRALLAVKRERHSLRPLVVGSVVLTAANLDDLPRLPALCRELGVDRLSGFPYSALGYQGRFGPEMTLAACRDRYDAIHAQTVEAARAHRISLELPPPGDEKQAIFGTEARQLYDFAHIEANQWSLGRFVSNLRFRKAPGSFCEYLWRLAPIGSTSKVHRAQSETHFMYPCIGPLSSLDLSRRAGFRFPDFAGFETLRRNAVFTHLRAAQHQPGLSPVCDVCRCTDARDPQHFRLLERLVGEFSQQHC